MVKLNGKVSSEAKEVNSEEEVGMRGSWIAVVFYKIHCNARNGL